MLNIFSLKELSVYTGSDVTLTLPGSLDVFDVRFISVYSTSDKRSYAQVAIPKALNVPPYINDSIVHIRSR